MTDRQKHKTRSITYICNRIKYLEKHTLFFKKKVNGKYIKICQNVNDIVHTL